MNYINDCVLYEEQIDGVTPWIWPKTDQTAFTLCKNDWPHLRDMWSAYVKELKVVVQAGGNCGMYPRLLSNYFERVYTFEPDPLNFNCLVANCQLDKIYKYQAALSDKRGMVKIDRSITENVGMVKVSPDGSYMVPTLTIDDLELDCCSFIQLDVEGYEHKVLKGARKTLERFTPVIAAENGTDRILRYLRKFGNYEHLNSAVVGFNRQTKKYRHEDVYGVI